MNPRFLKIISILSVLFWAALLIHVYLIFTEPLPDDTRVREFAERYRITSSLQVAAIAITGVTLSLIVWLRGAAWAALALTCLAISVLWRWYLVGLPDFLRPPLGDGTMTRATSVWWRLHKSSLGWHIVKVTLLAGSAIIWPFVYERLVKEQRRNGYIP